ncbi:unnamed protein product, partial [Ectocarpus sp. 12 AP-2014]
ENPGRRRRRRRRRRRGRHGFPRDGRRRQPSRGDLAGMLHHPAHGGLLGRSPGRGGVRHGDGVGMADRRRKTTTAGGRCCSCRRCCCCCRRSFAARRVYTRGGEDARVHPGGCGRGPAAHGQ